MRTSFIALLVVYGIIGVNVVNKKGIQWRNGDWAMQCDFIGNDFKDIRIRGDDCGPTCRSTSGCTHFVWTNYQGGTCWMKTGGARREDAVKNNDPSCVCGIVSSNTGNGQDNGNNNGGSSQGSSIVGNVYRNVHTTHHGATEVGACSLPQGDYKVRNPVALGDVAELGSLKYRGDLCGHILTVDCGNGPSDVIISNSNLGGGLDLYKSSWDKITRFKLPGVEKCSAFLTDKNPFSFDSPVCFHASGEVNNEYYRNIGLLNTRGKIVKSAKLNGSFGVHRGGNPYYAFEGRSSPNDIVTFFFEDNSIFAVALRDCRSGENKQIWS